MARRHIDPVEVLRSGGEPARFLWHDRLYVVREVLDHWVENEEWWQAGAAPGSAARRNRLEAAGYGGATANNTNNTNAMGIGMAHTTNAAGATATATLPAAEREVWRVEASAGRCAPLGVFDLRLDPAGSWTLARTLD
ncbi:DUF6504 family protein [Yinghuangia seranimata]|uniref:DUF6504 family protein n=1 Tax=Yinghuangia seranimata TaxID=408067 RepID=UPI00248BF1B4|nr:DUF6504 family protein [Yinghuangia seranimata]MDI2126170.1 DUF6504 family protein [Yinghuangia seranimata]